MKPDTYKSMGPARNPAERVVASIVGDNLAKVADHRLAVIANGRDEDVRAAVESSPEIRTCYRSKADDSAFEMRKQVRFRCDPNSDHTHVLDFPVIGKDGSRVACAMTPDRRIAHHKGPIFCKTEPTCVWNQSGTPYSLSVDSGSTFRSEVSTDIHTDLGATLVLTIPGAPPMRGMVERLFQSLKMSCR